MSRLDHDARLHELMALSAHPVSQRHLRILLRLAFYCLSRPSRRATSDAGTVVSAAPQAYFLDVLRLNVDLSALSAS